MKRAIVGLAATMLAAAGAGVPGRAASGALDALRTRDRQIREILNEQKHATTPQNNARLRQAVNSAFDYEAHARASFGRHWEQLSEPERKEGLRLVAILLERSAMDKVRQFSMEKIEYVSDSVDSGGAGTTVLTRVKRGTETAEIGYRMLPAGGAWKIVDIVVDGASTVESNRAAFAKEIRASGVRGLFEKLRKKAERNTP